MDHLLSTDTKLTLLNHPGTPTHLKSTPVTLSTIDLIFGSACHDLLTPTNATAITSHSSLDRTTYLKKKSFPSPRGLKPPRVNHQ